ncbi:MAG: GntR family transcriptional regulator [Bacteroidetes bacterium]|nr:GntR family transcriptional regulator [Bacteroidota bacterium]
MQTFKTKYPVFEIDGQSCIPKYMQVINSISYAIKKGELKKGDRIFSINEFSNEYFLSRDTVQKAYYILEERGVIAAKRGKGFYIQQTNIETKFRILLLFNKISNYKKLVYNSFIKTLGDNAVVDLKIHHSSAKVLEGFLSSGMNDYNYIVIMPHFYEDAADAYNLISKIPSEKLVILDKDPGYLDSNYTAVFQDFKNDITKALESGLSTLYKYNKLFLVFPKMVSYPPEIVTGFKNFCFQNNFNYQVIREISPLTEIESGTAFIVIEETDLVQLIKNCHVKKIKPGKDIGIISYNDTPLKEILIDGITVLSTDHAKMGETAARLILENRKEKIKNPFTLIFRKSL